MQKNRNGHVWHVSLRSTILFFCSIWGYSHVSIEETRTPQHTHNAYVFFNSKCLDQLSTFIFPWISCNIPSIIQLSEIHLSSRKHLQKRKWMRKTRMRTRKSYTILKIILLVIHPISTHFSRLNPPPNPVDVLIPIGLNVISGY